MEHVFTTGQDLDFIDLSLKKDGVVIDWLEFTLFQRRPVGLRGLSDQARREVFGAFGLAESARKWQERYDSVFDRCKTADSIRWVMKRHLEKGKDVLMMAAAYQWKTFSVEEVLQLLPSHMACGLEKLPVEYMVIGRVMRHRQACRFGRTERQEWAYMSLFQAARFRGLSICGGL